MSETADLTPTQEKADEPDCPSCSATQDLQPIYVIGEIAPRFPSPAVQREFEFERASLPPGLTERGYLVAVLEKRPDLARMMCWVLATQGIERYYLRPRTEVEARDLVDALRRSEESTELDTYVAVGWMAGSQNCGGIEHPVLLIEFSYHFELAAFLASMASAIEVPAKNSKIFVARSKEVFLAAVASTGNDGLGRFRALNWTVTRLASFYELISRSINNDEAIRSVETRVSADGTSLVEILVTLEPRKFGPASRYRLLIDVADLYPYPLGQSFTQTFDI